MGRGRVLGTAAAPSDCANVLVGITGVVGVEGGATIPGFTGPSYLFQASDVGNMVGGTLTMTNQDGSLTVPTSNTVGPIIAAEE